MMTPFHVVDLVTADDDHKYEPAGLMAEAIIEITQFNGSCDAEALRERGFTPEELNKHWHLAQSLSEVELRLIENEFFPCPPEGRRYA